MRWYVVYNDSDTGAVEFYAAPNLNLDEAKEYASHFDSDQCFVVYGDLYAIHRNVLLEKVEV